MEVKQTTVNFRSHWPILPNNHMEISPFGAEILVLHETWVLATQTVILILSTCSNHPKAASNLSKPSKMIQLESMVTPWICQKKPSTLTPSPHLPPKVVCQSSPGGRAELLARDPALSGAAGDLRGDDAGFFGGLSRQLWSGGLVPQGGQSVFQDHPELCRWALLAGGGLPRFCGKKRQPCLSWGEKVWSLTVSSPTGLILWTELNRCVRTWDWDLMVQ